MPHLNPVDISVWGADVAQRLWESVRDAPWGDLRGYWLRLIFDDRYLVCYFLPLVAVLLLFPRRRLRTGIVLTGLAFMTYVYGALYPVFWLVQCVAFHRLAERFAIESRRTDVIRWGPPLAAGALIVGWYLFTQALQELKIPNLTDGLHAVAPWIFPLGARSLQGRAFLWEPTFPEMFPMAVPDRPPPLFHALFYNPHNIGTAYFAVRMLHYFSEVRRGGIPQERRTLGNFLAYLCYAPNLMQGPIERFNEFQQEMDTCHERRGWRNLPPALGRVVWGVAKCLVATQYFGPVLWYGMGIGHPTGDRFYLRPWEIESTWLLVFGAHIQIFTLYLEFSGYCDVSAGIARILGYRQIENFRRPWLATSLRDFWHRWHISLSLILRDYVYIPLGGNRRHRTFNLCATFVLVGLWHAPLFKFVVWGVVMGLMLAVNQRWAAWMKRLDEAPAGALAAVRRGVRRLRPLPTIVSWALTQHCFCWSLLIFFGGSGAVRVLAEIARRCVGAGP